MPNSFQIVAVKGITLNVRMTLKNKQTGAIIPVTGTHVTCQFLDSNGIVFIDTADVGSPAFPGLSGTLGNGEVLIDGVNGVFTLVVGPDVTAKLPVSVDSLPVADWRMRVTWPTPIPTNTPTPNVTSPIFGTLVSYE